MKVHTLGFISFMVGVHESGKKIPKNGTGNLLKTYKNETGKIQSQDQLDGICNQRSLGAFCRCIMDSRHLHI